MPRPFALTCARLALSVLAFLTAAAPALAQEAAPLPEAAQSQPAAPAPAPANPGPASPDMATPSPDLQGVLLELNNAADTGTGACRLTLVTTNRLPQGLRAAAWQVAIFDPEGIVQSLPVLDFGALGVGKTKVAMFEIPDRRCDRIGRIVVNDVARCEAEDGADLRDACLVGLATQGRGRIDFGL